METNKKQNPTKAWEYINKDLNLLIILIFLEASKEKNESLSFADFFKGNYWDIDDLKQEVLDTNDYLSICDMVFEQVIFLFEDLGLGKIIQVGIGNTSEALRDLLIKVAEIGQEKAHEEAPLFTESVEQICFLEAQEQKHRAEEAEKNPEKALAILRLGNKSAFLPVDEYHSHLRAIQPIINDLPEHCIIRVKYDDKGVLKIEDKIKDFIEEFADDEFLMAAPDYMEKRFYFAQQIEGFYRYLNKQNFIGDSVNIPFTILKEKGFEAVKILRYLQLKKVIKMQWSDEGSWKVQFTKMPITPNSLLGIADDETNKQEEVGLKTDLSFDETKSILYIGNKTVKIRKMSDQYHLLRILFTDKKYLAKEWFYSEISEKYDFAARLDDKKFYNAAYQIKQKIARDAGLSDIFLTTLQSIHINPKYLATT